VLLLRVFTDMVRSVFMYIQVYIQKAKTDSFRAE